MLKKHVCMSLLSTIFVSLLALCVFMQPAAAQSRPSHQAAKSALRIACVARADRPTAKFGKIVASGNLRCQGYAQWKLSIMLYRVWDNGQEQVAAASTQGKGRSLHVTVDRYCQSAQYRSRVVGSMWDNNMREWVSIATADSVLGKATCTA